MTRIVRAAMTETRNAYSPMPDRVEDLGTLADRLDEVRDVNVRHHVSLIEAAAAEGARVIGLGELFHAPYFALGRDPMWRAMAENAEEGPTITALRSCARAQGVILVAPIYELDSATDQRFNTAVVIDETGGILGKYRKMHIPEGTNETATFCETFYYERSDGQLGDFAANVSRNRYFPVFETSVGRLAVATCYDRHFEGVMRTLAAEGAELVFSPAVTFGEKSRRLWELEFEVDAARHGLFIGGSNRIGAEAPWNTPYFGASHFVGPNGRLPRLPSREELVLADLDLDELTAGDPSGWNLARDARPDTFSD
jgi:predicted amidohydrolase